MVGLICKSASFRAALLVVGLLAVATSLLAWKFGGQQVAPANEPKTIISQPYLEPIFHEVDDHQPDEPVATITITTLQQVDSDDKSTPMPPRGSFLSSERLRREFRDVHRSEYYKHGLFRVDLIGGNIYEWQVKLFIVDRATNKLTLSGGELNEHIMLQMSYDDSYPSSPPFVRLVYPAMTSIYVHKGGALCMQILMRRNWKADCASETVIMDIARTLVEAKRTRVNPDPEPSKVEQVYTAERARATFARMAKADERLGW